RYRPEGGPAGSSASPGLAGGDGGVAQAARAAARLGADAGGEDPRRRVPAQAALGALQPDVRLRAGVPHQSGARRRGEKGVATAAARDRLTPQQRDAVFRREVSVVLSSGAGCGKTHVLTRRYLSHLEHDGAEVGQIVAITFTDRAARQMRDRIRKALLDHLERAESADDVRRCTEHLRGLETAQISTIHAFCGNLLRQHAVEAGLDPRFDILQDYLAANLQREALTN